MCSNGLAIMRMKNACLYAMFAVIMHCACSTASSTQESNHKFCEDLLKGTHVARGLLQLASDFIYLA